MTVERNDLMPNQKLEWVTPKISLMEAGLTNGSGKVAFIAEVTNTAQATNPGAKFGVS